MQPIPVRRFETYAEFDSAVGFAERAGWQLSDLQQQDANSFAGWPVYLNRYEVGGGKTVVGTVVSYMKGVEVTIVAVPPILIEPWTNWLRQIHGNAGVVAYDGKNKGGPKFRDVLRTVLRSARWIICSHQIYLKDKDFLDQAIADRHYEIVVDEAQALKNIESKLFQRTQILLAGGRDGGLLTATPTNKPEDSFAYMALKTPDLYRGWAHWEAVHVTKKSFIGKKPEEYGNLDILSENFGLRSILRTKEELHGYNNKPLTPDSSYRLSPAHYKLYQKLIDEALLELPNGMKIDATTAQRMYHASQQIIINLDYYSGDPEARPAFFDLLDLVIEQTEADKIGKSKLLIWTYYRRTSRTVWEYLKKRGHSVVAAYGETNAPKSVRDFMFDEKVRLMVGQPGSMGAGLNPQHVCWESIAAEISTNPIHAVQSSGRIDRVGQLHKPTIRTGRAVGTVQVGLLDQLLNNGDMVAKVEGNPKRLRDILMGASLADL